MESRFRLLRRILTGPALVVDMAGTVVVVVEDMDMGISDPVPRARAPVQIIVNNVLSINIVMHLQDRPVAVEEVEVAVL